MSGIVRAIGGARRPFSVRAPRVVLAAGALRTPVLLARSGIRHPALGARLWLAPASFVFATDAGGTREAGGHRPGPWSGPLAGVRSERFARPGPADPRGPGPAHGGFLIGSAPLHPGLLASLLPWAGASAHDALMHEAAALVPLVARIAEREPGRLVLERDGAPRLERGTGGRDAASLARGRVELARLARAAGAVRITAAGGEHALGWSADDGEGAFAGFLEALARSAPRGLLSVAQAGTACAGRDPAAAPCDPWGRVRRSGDGVTVRGLAVADASLAPGPMGPDPAVTVMLLAERVTRSILAERGARP